MTRTSPRTPLLCLLVGSLACSTSSGGNTGGAAPATGGAPGTGGQSATGGAQTGGSTGTGGSATGGAGGAIGATGGAGGKSATGGATSTGGAGGAPAATGGISGGGGSGPMACPALPTAVIAAKDITQLNDDGGWCWYQDERVVVDAKTKKAVIGSVATGSGRNGNQEAVIYDLAGGTKTKYTLGTGLNPDDHNAPGFVVNPDGTYMSIWATHRDTCLSYYSIYDGTAWYKMYKTYDWTQDGCEWDGHDANTPHKVTYANPWYLSAESKILMAARSVSTSPAFLQSSDNGATWKFYGRLSSTKQVGYVSGYYKYWGNGTDRIDFVGTENHPRDYDNNLWHGYYKGGKIYDSNDKVIDDNAGDKNAQSIEMYTSVFATGTMVKGTTDSPKLYHLWNHDLTRYTDGTIAFTGQGRTDPTTSPVPDDPDKRMIYSRWDGKTWKTTYLVKAGPKLYADEQDYTGLSAVHPDNPNVIFVSSTFDPRTDKEVPSKKHEIFMGVTCDNGATFKWAPLTENSTKDNLRPVVPKWDANHTFLLWERGDYVSAQKYKTEIVGTTVLSTSAP